MEAVSSASSSKTDSESAARAEPKAARRFAVAALLFAGSGATGLVDQVCFSKYLTYIVGSTAYAVSAVLAAFMTGLSLGANFGGRASRRVLRPLWVYGLLELVVALAVVLTPTAFHALTPLYTSLAQRLPDSLAGLTLLRWVVALGLLLVPTIAMGATLPVLSRVLDWDQTEGDPHAARERRLGRLYAVNTLGGAIGALAAAYVILPAFGIADTLRASAAASAVIGLIALACGRSVTVPSAPGSDVPGPAQRAPAFSADLRRLLALAFLSGGLVFAAEVVFTHLLALIIGNSAYAFGVILAAFLSCLFFGASQAGALWRRLGDAALPLGLIASGVSLVVTLPAWDLLPYVFDNTGEVLTSFAAREATRGGAAFAMLVLPTTLMGLTFPLLLQRVARGTHVGQSIGLLAATNTVGAVLGSLCTGYLLLPWLGSQRALSAIALAFVAAGLGVRDWAKIPLKRWLWLGSACAVGLAIGAPRWDLARLTSGMNVYFDGYHPPDAVLMVREDVHGGVTTVTRSDDVLTLYTNGKFQGNNGWEMNAQRFFAHYPSLFVKNFDELLVIGLGTGTTLGTLAGYPWRHVDVAEISPSILEAARGYFYASNRRATEDPRVSIQHADGRNFLLLGQKSYNLISIELSSVWFAGAASLYSREFYELVHRRLARGGVFQQWVQLHHIQRRDLATLMHTLRREFAHVILFYGGGQGILVASEEPLHTTRARIRALEANPHVAATIPNGRALEELLNDVLVLDTGLDRFLADSAEQAGTSLDGLISTDENLYLEYATPRGNVLPWAAREELVAGLRGYREPNAVRALITDE